MPAMEMLCQIMGIKASKFSKGENFILEAELFVRVCKELKELFRMQNTEYFRLIKLNNETEESMLEANFIRFIISDILTTREYSVEGIAYYTQSSVDVICDVVTGRNTEPSLPLSRRIIDLHRSVRPKLYRGVMEKVISEYHCDEESDETGDDT